MYRHYIQHPNYSAKIMSRDMGKNKYKQNDSYHRCIFTASRKKLSRNLLNIHTLNFKTGGFDMVDAFNSCNLSSISLNLENRDLSEIH